MGWKENSDLALVWLYIRVKVGETWLIKLPFSWAQGIWSHPLVSKKVAMQIKGERLHIKGQRIWDKGSCRDKG